ncbi:MAG: 1-(5-phosphoribosyl)-5-[(5-phosphoribosylamino)methylideneamino]imidazole-4-carboxamide isomerase [Enterococcus sp.]
MKIYPAIDLLNKKVVRLYQGDYDKQEVFGDDPVQFAQKFVDQGARYLHLVDLDGAKDGQQRHFEVASQIVKQTSLNVEVGGGIRDEATIESCLESGVSQVILGTLAQANPELTKQLLKKYGEKIVVGVDARDGLVAVEGWLKTTDTTAYEFCEQLAQWGCKRVIYTEISKDGTGEGLDIELYANLNRIEGLDITASGGVSSMKDIQSLADLNLEGVIVGKSLYNGQLSLEELIKIAGPQR